MSTFIGRKASPCRKCRCVEHYVNRMGGIVCSTCNPPKNPETDVMARLTIEGGVWIDPANRFDLIDVPAAATAQTTNAGALSTPETRRGAVPAAALPAAGAAGAAGAAERGSSPQHGRGPRGELSLTELDVFGSDLVWDSDEVDVKLVPARAGAMRPATVPDFPRRSRRGLNSDGRVASPATIVPGDERPVVRIVDGGELRAGCEVDVLRRLETFGGYAEPGPAVVDSVGRDAAGRSVVTLRRGGKVIVSGLEV